MILDHPEAIARYTALGWWQQVTVDDMFRACVAAHPDQAALLDAPNRNVFAFGEPQSLSFAEVDAATDALAALLLRHHVRKDDIVVLQLPNIVEIVIAFLACARIGAIASPVMLAYGERDVRRIIGHIRPKCILTLSAFKGTQPGELVKRLCAEMPGLKTSVITLGAQAGDMGDLAHHREDLSALHTYLRTLRIDGNDIVTMHWTSGTTGHPKCVPHSHNQWRATGGCCVDAGGLQHGDRILAPMQMVHTAGYNGMFLPWLETQGTLVLHQPFDMAVFLNQIESLRINHTVTAPAMLNALLRDNVLDNHDVSAIRSILCGSAPLDPWMIEGFKTRYNIEIVNAFGSTEGLTLLSSASITADPHRRARYFPRFRGNIARQFNGVSWGIRIAAGVETKLVDLNTGAEITTPREPGEFAFRSPSLFPGYYTAEGTLDRSDFDAAGYFKSGEIFEIAGDAEEQDFYHYIDRLKDVINRGGVKVPAGELEAAMQALPSIREAAAIGYPDEKLGERICAVVALAKDAALTLESLNAALLASGVAKFMWPERLEIVPALPRNTTGKILKRELVRDLTARPT
ncbi:MAG: acyl--CoA ligase [Rhodospirillaceae bacterium]|nr:acyl--CoA ligase [Rhodospirillaceae bacterium]